MDVNNRISSDFYKSVDIVNNSVKKEVIPKTIDSEVKKPKDTYISSENSSKINIVIEEDKERTGDLVGVNTAEGSYIGTELKDSTKGALEEMKKNVIIRRNLEYSIHEETNRVIAKVTNSETGEVIREIPSEQKLDLLSKIISPDGQHLSNDENN